MSWQYDDDESINSGMNISSRNPYVPSPGFDQICLASPKDLRRPQARKDNAMIDEENTPNLREYQESNYNLTN